MKAATPEMTRLAMAVLEEAQALERGNLKFDAKTVSTWARCFMGQPIWPDEALEAVHAHYRQPSAYPIKPGEVLAYCAEQPVWSSREHVDHFLDTWKQHPYASVIEDYSGIRPPDWEVPPRLPHAEEKAILIGHLSKWIDENRDELATAILARRHKSVHA